MVLRFWQMETNMDMSFAKNAMAGGITLLSAPEIADILNGTGGGTGGSSSGESRDHAPSSWSGPERKVDQN